MNKKRFKSEKQILEAIAKCHDLSQRRLMEADATDAEADAAFRRANTLSDINPQAAQAAGEFGSYKRAEAKKKRKTATNLIQNKAKKLGQKLSEFRIMLMPGMPGDDSVQV